MGIYLLQDTIQTTTNKSIHNSSNRNYSYLLVF